MNKSKLLLLLSIISASVLLSSQENVKVSLYYEALCPYCQEFIREQLYPAYQVIGDALTMEMVPYGNAKKENNTEWKVTCQHGPKECYANKIQACVLGFQTDEFDLNDARADSMNFIGCIMSTEHPDQKRNARKCADKNKLSWSDIKICVNGNRGDELIHYFGNKTDSLIPKMRYVPHIVFNDKYDESSEDAARNDFLGTVCGMFRAKPSGCK